MCVCTVNTQPNRDEGPLLEIVITLVLRLQGCEWRNLSPDRWFQFNSHPPNLFTPHQGEICYRLRFLCQFNCSRCHVKHNLFCCCWEQLFVDAVSSLMQVNKNISNSFHLGLGGKAEAWRSVDIKAQTEDAYFLIAFALNRIFINAITLTMKMLADFLLQTITSNSSNKCCHSTFAPYRCWAVQFSDLHMPLLYSLRIHMGHILL